MSKGKGSRKRRAQESSELVPSSAPTPTPSPSPSPERRPIVSERHRSALVDLVSAVRQAVGALLDLADEAAEVITKQLERRA
jgi:hypothetical protein